MAYVYSNAPSGKRTVTNIYYDPSEDKVKFIYITRGKLITVSSVELDNYPSSKPPPGKYKVNNLYVDPETGRLIVEYDNTPVT